MASAQSISTRLALSAVAALLISCGVAFAEFMSIQDTPIERLVSNLTSKTKVSPEDANAWYALGRVHSMAFTRSEDHVPTYQSDNGSASGQVLPDDGVPGGPPRHAWRPSDGTDTTKKLDNAERLTHLDAGLRAFERAIALDPKSAAQRMSYGFL